MIRRLDTAAEVARASALFAAVWASDARMMPPNLVRAVDHAGGYAYAAYDDSGAMLAASVAFLGGDPGDVYLYSHVTGVLAAARGTGLGKALKLHQRDWCLARGIDRIVWTFDPLVRRNAAFNITALGALPTRYLVDFYGPMDDGINRGDETDRLLVEWRLREPRATPTEPTRTVAVPADVEALRESDPAAAREWRHRVRERLGGALAEGWWVVAFGPEGYVLNAPAAARSS